MVSFQTMAHRRYLSLALLNFKCPGDRVQSTRWPLPSKKNNKKWLKASGVFAVDLRPQDFNHW